MAGRPSKKTETTVKKAETNKDDMLLALSKQIEEMNKKLLELSEENKVLKENVTKETQIEELNSDTEIPVVSMCVGRLVLSTLGNGLGNIYRFEKFGEIQDIPFGDLKEIVKNKPYFAKEGAFYIANEEVVKKLRLTRDYEHIISNKMFETLLNQNAEVVVEAYKTAPDLQKSQVVSLIEDKLASGADIDGNILIKIGKICGKSFIKNEEEE